jgi:hypothetical protein
MVSVSRGAGAFVFSGGGHRSQNNRLRFEYPSGVHVFRAREFFRDTTNHGSPRHAANPQLLAKRVLLVAAISLHSGENKFEQSEFELLGSVRSFFTGGALQCPKQAEGCGVRP